MDFAELFVFRPYHEHGFLNARTAILDEVFGHLVAHFVVGDVVHDEVDHFISFWQFDNGYLQDLPEALIEFGQ